MSEYTPYLITVAAVLGIVAIYFFFVRKKESC